MLKVLPWTGPSSISRAAFDANPLVLSIATSETSLRDPARALVREALRDVLGALLACPPESVPLVFRPGHAISLDSSAHRIGISVSHEPGLSIAAIHAGGNVGVDLMRSSQVPAWLADWENLARDYLGPQASESIARQPPSDQVSAFVRKWTCLEARLKCLGMPLQEWSPELDERLQRCDLFDLDLPAGFAGVLATVSDGLICDFRAGD